VGMALTDYISAVSLLFCFAMGRIRGTAHAELHLGTASHNQVSSTNLLFLKTLLQRKDLTEITDLAWAQEAPGANPGAPTKILIISHLTMGKSNFRFAALPLLHSRFRRRFYRFQLLKPLHL